MMEQRPVKVEFVNLGPHNGMGDPDKRGSYTAFAVVKRGGSGDWPQRLVFMAPTHQLSNLADQKERE